MHNTDMCGQATGILERCVHTLRAHMRVGITVITKRASARDRSRGDLCAFDADLANCVRGSRHNRSTRGVRPDDKLPFVREGANELKPFQRVGGR